MRHSSPLEKDHLKVLKTTCGFSKKNLMFFILVFKTPLFLFKETTHNCYILVISPFETLPPSVLF